MIRALAILCGLTLGCSGREPKHVVLQSSQPDTHSVRGAGPMDARRSDGVRQYCARSTGTIRVSEDSVGPFELWTPLRALRNICPSADDTIVYDTETSTPASHSIFRGSQLWPFSFRTRYCQTGHRTFGQSKVRTALYSVRYRSPHLGQHFKPLWDLQSPVPQRMTTTSPWFSVPTGVSS